MSKHPFRTLIIGTSILYLSLGGLTKYILENDSTIKKDPVRYQYYKEHYSFWTWPKIFTINYEDFVRYKQHYEVQQQISRALASSNEVTDTDKGRLLNIELKLKNGEIKEEEAQYIINSIGDTYLGQGKTERLLDAMQNPDNGTVGRIIDEVPTNLPSGLDKLVKGYVKKTTEPTAKEFLK